MIEEDEREVRRMLATGELEGHRKGKRGVRVYLDSVRAWQDRRSIEATSRSRESAQVPVKRPSAASIARHQAALAGLRAKGIL